MDAFHAALHVATTPGLPFRCCFGSAEERDAAFGVLDAATEIVLDPTALGTLYLLDVLVALKAAGKRLLVPPSMLLVVRNFAREARQSERAVGTMGATSTGTFFHVASDAEKAAFRDRAERFKVTLEESVAASPTTALVNMSAPVRQRLEQALEPLTVDAVALASGHGRVLWTDDREVAQFARAETGAATAWTQVVLLWLLQRGMLEAPIYLRASAELAGYDYTFTSLSPAVVAKAAGIAEWHADRWPLKQTIAQLGTSHVRPEDGAHLGAMLIRDAFTEPLPVQTRQAILFAVCTSLAARGDGFVVLEGLERIVARIFGLNVVGAQQAALAMRAWKAPPKILLPNDVLSR